MSTPPDRRQNSSDPGSAPRRPPGPGAGLVAARPDGQPAESPSTGQGPALGLPGGTPAAAGETATRGTSELALVGTGAPAPAAVAAPAVLGQRAGAGQVEGAARGVSRGQGQGPAKGLATSAAAVQAVAAAPRGIGAAFLEPDEGPEPEPQAGAAVASKPVSSRRTVALLGIRAGQFVSWELAILAVALVYRERLNVLIPVAVGALLLIAVTALRRHGHWLYQWLGLWLRYQTRHRRRRIAGGDEAAADDVAGTLLACVVRGASIVPVEIDEIGVALISHVGGLTAVLEVAPVDAGHVVEPSQILPPLPALLPNAEIGEPLISVQIIIQSIPAPSFLGLADSAAISYRELAGGVVPATRGCWLAVQAQHIAEDYTAKDLQESVIRAVKRLQRRLRKSGLQARLLNPEEVATELLSLARVDAREAPPLERSRRRRRLTTPGVQESWRTWSAGPQVHTTFRLLDWPDLADPAGRELLDRLVHTPTLATTVTVAARRRAAAEDVELEAAIRFTLPDGAAVESSTKEVQSIVDVVGGRVERLDGEQVFGVAATLPLGGFLS